MKQEEEQADDIPQDDPMVIDDKADFDDDDDDDDDEDHNQKNYNYMQKMK